MSEIRPKRVLIVDDEADVREYLQAALEDAGFEVETACDGLEALEAVRRSVPDLISLDLVMPHHSGARFYHDLQKDKELSTIPVLIVTGHARDELGRADFREMTMSGPGVYLEKPVRPDSYVKAVCRLLGMEASEGKPPTQDELRDELSSALAGADRDTLKRALEALKKR
jgi:CheY-like chemotaxis protein